MDTTGHRIASLIELEAEGLSGASLVAGIDAVFFEAATRRYDDPAARAAFHRLWVGQYLEADRDKVHLAVTRDGCVLGYLVGCFDNAAASPRFASLDYFKTFAAVCSVYPAHLHINLTAQARSRGIGRNLIEAFCRQTALTGLSGVHVVTAPTSRNVSFYNRAGFKQCDATNWNGHPLVFLGRALTI